MTKLGTLLCTGMMVFSAPAFAGFEFMPRIAAPAPAAPAMPQAAPVEGPMPIIPVEPVSGEVLAAPDKVLSTRVSRPMEPEALLSATASTSSPAFGDKLVINPYPLQGDALHGGDMGVVSVEQAMLEESGLLRPIGTPNMSAAGMAARAHSNAAPMARPAPQAEEIASSITPLPGEGSLTPVEVVPVPRMPAPAANYAPAPTRGGNNYSEAVGFGRELPLALALSQVVPPEYSYSFAQDVNAGATVSWEGGKPWNVVLNEMLASSGMRADIQGQQIVITAANS